MALLGIDSGSPHPFARMIEGGRGQGQGGNRQEDNKLQITNQTPCTFFGSFPYDTKTTIATNEMTIRFRC